MSNVIDSLIVELGLDPAKFTKGQKDSAAAMAKLRADATRTSKLMEERGKVAAEFFGKVRAGAIGLTGALLGAAGIKEFAIGMTTSNAALGRLARNVGMSVKDLGAWEGAAEATGGSAEGMASTIRGITKDMQMFHLTGKSGMLPFLYAARVDVQKFTDSATPAREQLLLLSDALYDLHDPVKAQALGQAMGIDEATINMLVRGRKEVTALLTEVEKSQKVSEADTQAAENLAKSWSLLTTSAKGAGLAIMTNLAPALETAMDWLKNDLMAGDSDGSKGKNWWEQGGTKGGMGIRAGAAAGEATKEWLGYLFGGAKTASTTNRSIGGAGGAVSGDALSSLISRGEGGYNSVNLGKNGGYKSSTADLENMTIADVMRAQSTGQFNAAGKYQIIGSTLSDAVKNLGIDTSNKFDATTQDSIFRQYLLGVKRKAIADYLSGKSADLKAAEKAGAMEWASVADPDTGASYYSGVGGNRASISTAEFASALQTQRAANISHSSSTSDTRIGQVTVVTQATDAAGIAKDIGGALKGQSFAQAADPGIN